MHERAIETLTPESFRRIRQVFESALDRPPGERRAFIDAECANDPVLLAEVARMLAAEEGSSSLLGSGARMGPPREGVVVVCASCRAAMAPTDRFCRTCGTPARGPQNHEGRFRPGALFAGRFRIVGRLGRGGMGDVYRADDLELGQPVALKFLTTFRSDARARARLRTEVRLSRQISHPNVCRVYDIGEAGGDLYLSMEYVDGEDLAALLKRIGRLPIDKGVEIARRLCVGLAAAHAKGVLHRDFKPANIMIDGHGEVRILDFGLASVAEGYDGPDVRSGTPAYMAPEQLAGREATAQSDIYSLGLVLYELFTGKEPFEAKTAEEFLRLREGSHPTRPSSLIPELSERIERAILRCLDPDPKLRPVSPLQVSATLPGGDPLAEALAAGETPSPDVVASAGATGTSNAPAAMTLVTSALAGLIAICVLTSKIQTLGLVSLENQPETLSVRARDIIRDLGYTERPADFAFGFQNEDGFLDYFRERFSGGLRSRLLQWRQTFAVSPSPVSFWYRQSPLPLVVENRAPGPDHKVSLDNPFPGRRGMISVIIDLKGRLRRFIAIPENETTLNAEPKPPDWPALFAAAGLDIARFNQTAPQSTFLMSGYT
jgi:serine/threonine protein kinase